MEGFDLGNMQQTAELNYTMVSPLTTIGTLTACDTIDEFITYTLDGGTPVVITGTFNVSAGAQGTTNGITVYTNQSTVGFYLWGSPQEPGTYSNDEFSIESSEIGYIGVPTINDMVYQVHSFGAVGEYIDMTFNGTYEYQGVTRTLSGVIHVKRDQ